MFLERMSDTQCATAQHNSENSTQGSVLSPSLPVGKGGPFMSESEHIVRKRAHRSLASACELIVSWRSPPSRPLQGPTPATRDIHPNVLGGAGVSPQCVESRVRTTPRSLASWRSQSDPDSSTFPPRRAHGEVPPMSNIRRANAERGCVEQIGVGRHQVVDSV